MICQFQTYIQKIIIKLRKNSSFNWFTPLHVLIRPDVIWKKISRPLYHVDFTVIHTNSRHNSFTLFMAANNEYWLFDISVITIKSCGDIWWHILPTVMTSLSLRSCPSEWLKSSILSLQSFVYDLHDYKLWNTAKWQKTCIWQSFRSHSDSHLVVLWNAPSLSPRKN